MRLLVLGTGNMANQHAREFARIPGVTLAGAVDIDPSRLQAFCDRHTIAHSFAGLEEALDWGAFDAVANVTPDKMHFVTTMRIIAAGKHVFCEKPLATNAGLALEMTEAAEKAGLVAMVNLSYRKVAEVHKARDMVLAGDIGRLRHVEASYLQSWLVAKTWGDWREEPTWLWRLSKEHGSNGVLGDIGIHVLDFASFGAATDIESLDCRLKTFHKAEGDRIGDYQLDANDGFAMTVEFSNGAIGVIHASRFATGHLDDLHLSLFGDKGALEVKFGPKGSSLQACLGADVETQTWREVSAEPVIWNYQRFFEAVQAGRTAEPSFRRAADLQKLLDFALEGGTLA
jgi:predicted dehydrogenase